MHGRCPGGLYRTDLRKLATDNPEAIVDSVLPARANPGANEHAMVNAFNQSMVENPIPVA
jgi:uncharacterized oxidoreductase